MSLEFYTNDDLLDELMNRESFKGMVIWRKGEIDNTQADGDGGIRVRIKKGLTLLDVMTFMDSTMSKLRQQFPKAFNEYFQDRWRDVGEGEDDDDRGF